MNNDIGGAKSGSSTWQGLAAALACILTLLWVVPFNPAMPVTGVDGSWAYAMNVAVAEHLRFGKDIVFTFGPWASVYTGLFHPATDTLMIVGSLLAGLAVSAGFFALLAPSRRALLLLLPVVLALIWSSAWHGWRDALFLFLPVLLPCVVARQRLGRAAHLLVICLLCAAMAILPLAKGNVTVMVVFSMAVAMWLSRRASPARAVAMPAIVLLVMLLAWWACGQALADLPGYFLAQVPIISGYTEAMSVQGRSRDIVVFLVAGGLMFGVAVLAAGRGQRHVPLLVAAYLFLIFKSSFVRHDEQHAVIAAAALLLLGLLICFSPGAGAGRGPVALLLGCMGWAVISHGYVPMAPQAMQARLLEMVRSPIAGLWTRIAHPGELAARFRQETSRLGDRPPFARATMRADVYPWDLTPMIAAGQPWAPRPILQSYSAYTPGLVQANALHLQRNPPQRVYFNLNPIDGRYPSIEDGASWLPLLGTFAPVAIEGEFAVLERRPGNGSALVPGNGVQVAAVLGQEVPVPAWDDPVWITLDIQPTLAGRLASMAYKAPPLSLWVRYENGDTARFRLVAGMARTGFLLSPTLTRADEYVALASHHRQALLGKRRVVAMGVSGGSGTRLLWQQAYHLRFAPLAVPPSEQADAVLLGRQQAAMAPEHYATGGNCSIDEFDHRPVAAAPMDAAAGMVLVRGWAAVDAVKGVPNQGTLLLATGQDGSWHTVTARRVARPDVAAYFQQPGLEYAGFEAYLDVSRLAGDAQIRLVQADGSQQRLCSTAAVSLHRTDAPTPR
ncbi:hypothetical protein [Stenotrophomonas sp. 24(2023)]|uniref:hypothetical protein n=1 Tax=Stenotrophomonas sp. 24(2023) TaxID=3068324 RepID=UPI0027E149E2|nr:hypothetical protein [Stenotrophomonas sp. 24(2023)]WMJ67731.1 hypothetical protein Q9R17_10900 [Stenotrophomonas sp. 24(2023)]